MRPRDIYLMHQAQMQASIDATAVTVKDRGPSGLNMRILGAIRGRELTLLNALPNRHLLHQLMSPSAFSRTLSSCKTRAYRRHGFKAKVAGAVAGFLAVAA